MHIVHEILVAELHLVQILQTRIADGVLDVDVLYFRPLVGGLKQHHHLFADPPEVTVLAAIAADRGPLLFRLRPSQQLRVRVARRKSATAAVTFGERFDIFIGRFVVQAGAVFRRFSHAYPLVRLNYAVGHGTVIVSAIRW